jgi:hypothetical protein
VAGPHQGKARVFSRAHDEPGTKLPSSDDHDLSKSTAGAGSPATHERDHFQLVAVSDQGRPELRAPEDAPVPFDGDPKRIELQLLEKRLDRGSGCEGMRLAIEPDANLTGGYFFCSFL